MRGAPEVTSSPSGAPTIRVRSTAGHQALNLAIEGSNPRPGATSNPLSFNGRTAGCCPADGGTFPSYVMDFDHRGDKVGNISDLVGEGQSWTRVQAEISQVRPGLRQLPPHSDSLR